MRRRLVILGSTGSIGTSTLDVASRHPDRFEVVGLSAFTRIHDLARQCLRWQPRWAVVPDDSKAMQLRTALAGQARTEVCVGATALAQMAREPEVDCVMAAIVGAAGLDACMAAARAGKRLLLANKEALVVGGPCSCGGARRWRHAAAHRQRALGHLPVPARRPRAVGGEASTTSCSPRPAGRSGPATRSHWPR
jgi:1-deoxy-D-xylulose 5-phosphate reductoisomerase